jgi:hypothetical protein
MCALVANIASPYSPRHFRQVGLFAIAALPWLGCAKGVEIADGEVSFFTLNPPDAGGADSGANLATSQSATPPGGSNASSMPPAMSPPMTPASAAGSTQSGAPGAVTPAGAAGDAGTGDAGRAEDRPADAGD